MVIGFDASRAFTEERTGTENYSYQLLKALAKIDFKNEYIIYAGLPTKEDTFRGWPSNFNFTHIQWSRLWTQGGLALQTFKERLDVLFVPSHTLPIIRRPGLKTVVTVHDLGSEYLPTLHQVKQRIYLSFMQKVQLKGATRIIAVSKATKKDLVKRVGLDPDKIAVVYEGYDNKLFTPIKGDTLVDSLRQYELVPGEYFLFVGTVQPRKNLGKLMKAFSKAAARGFNVPALVIAGSKGWMSNHIYKLPKKLGIEDKVEFLGYVPDEQLPILYSGALALVFPSLFEGFGLPILEAQACGCPVITSDVSSMPEVAGKGAILVNPYDVEAIAHAMIRVKRKEKREKLVKAGFKNIKRFSWEKCARETLTVLEEAMKL